MSGSIHPVHTQSHFNGPDKTVPLISVAGTAFDCGRQYAEIVIKKFPGYPKDLPGQINYMNAGHWLKFPPEIKRLFEAKAPYIPEVFRGIQEIAGPWFSKGPPPKEEAAGCTSFGLSNKVTLSGEPISGQNKDANMKFVDQYIVLRMRMKDAPTILVLAYGGEVLGYGMWSTGMSIFRTSLFSSKGSPNGLSMAEWGFLTLAGKSVHEGVELAQKYGIAGEGACLISDPQGESVAVEFNCGGVGIIPAQNGIVTHGNHPEAPETAPYEDYSEEVEKLNSRFRMHGLWQLFDFEKGRLTAQRAYMTMADHSRYPVGICRHRVPNFSNAETSATIIAEPTLGKLHVVHGQPCCNWPATYTI